jgi:hypothetical protein
LGVHAREEYQVGSQPIAPSRYRGQNVLSSCPLWGLRVLARVKSARGRVENRIQSIQPTH